MTPDEDVVRRRSSPGALWCGHAPSPGLSWLVEQIWRQGADSRVVVTVDGCPPGHRLVEQYLIVPSVESARILVPSPSRRVARASLLAYNQLRSRRTRLAKRSGAFALTLGLPGLICRDRLSICVRENVREERLADLLLIAHLAAQLGRGPLAAAVGLGSPGPNRKPTLQLFTTDGAPAAYVKVGWNDYTRMLVERETSVLSRLSVSTDLGLPSRPAVLSSGTWRGLSFVATEPLPRLIRSRTSARLDVDSATLRVASLGRRHTSRLGDSDFARHLLDELRTAARNGSLDPHEAELTNRYLQQLLSRYGNALVRFGAWHGDWSSWNMGQADGQLWVWDWEHFGEEAPLGFDAVHQAFQSSFHSRQADAATALAAAETGLRRHLEALDVQPAQARLIVSSYLLEMLFRACQMHRLGAGWNPRLRQGLLSAMSRREP